MQERHTNRRQYFEELAATSEKYFIPYIERYVAITQGMNILEVGCGNGGNLLPLARRGCRVTGADLSVQGIENAKRFFSEQGAEGRFIASDVFLLRELDHSFDLIICHDVIEHIGDKAGFLLKCKSLLKNGGGVMFIGFPAWQMPFGGHQQICKSRIVSRAPFIHLLPKKLYAKLLHAAGESEGCIDELLSIKETRCTIELFERMIERGAFTVMDRTLYFINPHYETKFHLRPRLLPRFAGRIPYLRNYFTTSCFYMLKLNE